MPSLMGGREKLVSPIVVDGHTSTNPQASYQLLIWGGDFRFRVDVLWGSWLPFAHNSVYAHRSELQIFNTQCGSNRSIF